MIEQINAFIKSHIGNIYNAFFRQRNVELETIFNLYNDKLDQEKIFDPRYVIENLFAPVIDSTIDKFISHAHDILFNTLKNENDHFSERQLSALSDYINDYLTKIGLKDKIVKDMPNHIAHLFITKNEALLSSKIDDIKNNKQVLRFFFDMYRQQGFSFDSRNIDIGYDPHSGAGDLGTLHVYDDPVERAKALKTFVKLSEYPRAFFVEIDEDIAILGDAKQIPFHIPQKYLLDLSWQLAKQIPELPINTQPVDETPELPAPHPRWQALTAKPEPSLMSENGTVSVTPTCSSSDNDSSVPSGNTDANSLDSSSSSDTDITRFMPYASTSSSTPELLSPLSSPGRENIEQANTSDFVVVSGKAGLFGNTKRAQGLSQSMAQLPDVDIDPVFLSSSTSAL